MNTNPYSFLRSKFVNNLESVKSIEKLLQVFRLKKYLRKISILSLVYFFNVTSRCVQIKIAFFNEEYSDDLILRFKDHSVCNSSDKSSLHCKSKQRVEGEFPKGFSSSFHNMALKRKCTKQRDLNSIINSSGQNHSKTQSYQSMEPINWFSGPTDGIFSNFGSFNNQKQNETQCLVLENPSNIISTCGTEKRKRILPKKHLTTYLIFDYSSEFLIRCELFDYHLKLGVDYVTISINDVTKNEVNRHLFSLLLISLRFGYDPALSGLKNEHFLDFVSILTDLSVYSESNALNMLYRYLFSFLLHFEPEFYKNFTLNPYNPFVIRYKQILIPFLDVLFDQIEIISDLSKNEVSFHKIDRIKRSNFLYTFEFYKIKIRITPEALNAMKLNSCAQKRDFFKWFLDFYMIKGIRISTDDSFYSDCKDPDKASDYLKNINSVLETSIMDSDLFQILVQNHKKTIKLVELERVILSEDNIENIKHFSNLEILIFVSCVIYKYRSFLNIIEIFYPKLRILKLIGFRLSSKFFNVLTFSMLEDLDLSLSNYIGNPGCLLLQEKSNRLTSFKMDHTCFCFKIINFFMKSKLLKRLSIRNADLSYFRKNISFLGCHKSFDFLDLSGSTLGKLFLSFFSQNLKSEVLVLKNLKRRYEALTILNQTSLYLSTKHLRYSEDNISRNFFYFLRYFCYLESLEILDTSITMSEWQHFDLSHMFRLKSVNLSQNRLSDYNFNMLPLGINLDVLNVSECNLNVGLMSFLCFTKKSDSFKKIDISGNQLSMIDLAILIQFKNLTHLKITLANDVMANYFKEYGALCCENLKSLVFVSTSVEVSIFQFVMLQNSLLKLKFKFCTIYDTGLTRKNIFALKFLKKVTFFQTHFHPEVLKILDLFQILKIPVTFH
ncbi:hypothetical protein CWI39_0367p0020 [Hamiltosporidium magnivora]|uniref:Leucine-rich repeat-containing protein n=1 Tax=Hamiltosporidium magnivora TaxID=148818 RepID=A0A4V2JWA0_9MICR|nr:hypothetical protein CWI39_0367p0020 [Hamiltosporidium magnivora]